MKDMIPSPFFHNPYQEVKSEALKFLDDMTLPEPKIAHATCSRECHIIERNYVLSVVRERLQQLL